MNMMGHKRGQRGFTLIEILIVLAVLAVLAAVVVPNVAGYLGRGKERGFESDQRMLQSAVDAWRTDVRTRAGNPWPTVGGVKGTPTDAAGDGDLTGSATDVPADADVNSILNLSDLSPTYIKGTDAVKSFKHATAVTGATGATNSPVGSSTGT